MAERPVECTHCKKPIAVLYKEIVGNTINEVVACADCPIVLQKLHGSTGLMASPAGVLEAEKELCCSNCQTTLEAVRTGNPLGCSECYAVFAPVLISDLITAEKIPSRLRKLERLERSTEPLHMGKAPGQIAEIAPSHRLSALNEALSEALQRENYEQAALLRDQIKAILEKKP